MRMHAGTIIIKYRFRHERNSFPITLGNILDDVLVPHELVSHLQQW